MATASLTQPRQRNSSLPQIERLRLFLLNSGKSETLPTKNKWAGQKQKRKSKVFDTVIHKKPRQSIRKKSNKRSKQRGRSKSTRK